MPSSFRIRTITNARYSPGKTKNPWIIFSPPYSVRQFGMISTFVTLPVHEILLLPG